MPLLDILGSYTEGRSDRMGNYLHPLFPQFLSGANIFTRCSHTLPASICLVSPETMYSCAGTTSAAGSRGGGPPAQTPKEDQQPADYEGYGIGRCWS